MTDDLLILKNIHCGYGTRPVLNGIDLTLKKGETVLLAGPNGCGKSTMLKAIIGMLPLDEGSISFNGIDMAAMSTEKRVKSGIGYLRQTGNIFPGQTVIENLELAGLTMDKKTFNEAFEHVLNVFEFLKEDLHKRAGTLSGGQRQALAIAMVLLHKKPLYLLDEPTAGLSPKAAVDIMERVHRFTQEDSNQTVLMVEHRLELLQWISHAVILIQGKIQAETSDASLLLDQQWMEKHYF